MATCKMKWNFYGYYNEFEYNHDYEKLMKYSYIYISMYTKYNYTHMCESNFVGFI